jgi:hypothetical protein
MNQISVDAPERTAGNLDLRADGELGEQHRSVVVLRRAGRRCGSAATDRAHPVRPRRRSHASARPVTDVVVERRRRSRPRSSCSSATAHPLAHWPAAAARRAHEHDEEEGDDDGGHPRRRDTRRSGTSSCGRHGARHWPARTGSNGWSWPAMS